MILAALALALIACESDVTMDETPQPTPHVSARQHLVHEAADGRLVLHGNICGRHGELAAAERLPGVVTARRQDPYEASSIATPGSRRDPALDPSSDVFAVDRFAADLDDGGDR